MPYTSAPGIIHVDADCLTAVCLEEVLAQDEPLLRRIADISEAGGSEAGAQHWAQRLEAVSIAQFAYVFCICERWPDVIALVPVP